MVKEWAKIIGIDPVFIYMTLGLIFLAIIHSLNKTAGYTLGGLAILAILTNDKWGK